MAFDPVQTFLEEAEDILADVDQSLLTLSEGVNSAETIHRLFRGFHTLKGSGAMCGLEKVALFTHHVENLLDRLRDGTVSVSAPMTEMLLRAADHIRLLLGEARGGAAAPPEQGESLVAEIARWVNCGVSPYLAPERKPQAAVHCWRVRFRPHRDFLANGGNPKGLLDELRSLGPCEISAHWDEIPELGAIETDWCYLWWTILLRSACAEDAIRDVFLFVEDDSGIEIQAIEDAPEALPESRPAAKISTRQASVRVPAERLDRLVNLVGELVMNHSCLAQAVLEGGASDLANPVQALERLVAELRENVLGIRMLPIGALFGRFRRVAHDLAAELGKEAELVTEGEETELDKSILDQLGKPLTHCLRNCLDH